VAPEFDVFTMGFSNRTWDDTLAILQRFSIARLVDIRTLPGSKHTPQFNQQALQDRLPETGIECIHLKSLGGLRKPNRQSAVNVGWRNEGFRGYADYMQTPQFEESLQKLIRLLDEKRTVYVCTEAVFWRCHRQLVSDALRARGYRVGHIFTESKVEEHKITSFARVEGDRVTYPVLLHKPLS